MKNYLFFNSNVFEARCIHFVIILIKHKFNTFFWQHTYYLLSILVLK
jgi:hypothetical protein